MSKALSRSLSDNSVQRNPEMVTVDDHVWLVSVMHYDLGYFDDETGRLRPIDNPFAQTVTHVSGINCHPCARNRPRKIGGAARI